MHEKICVHVFVCMAWNSKPKLQQSDFNPPVWSTFVFPFQKIDRKESDGTVSLAAKLLHLFHGINVIMLRIGFCADVLCRNRKYAKSMGCYGNLDTASELVKGVHKVTLHGIFLSVD